MTTLRIVESASASNPNERDLYVDDSGQLEWIGTGDSDSEDYARYIAQLITTRLRFIRGEWYQDQRQGVPWMDRVIGHKSTESTVRSIITSAIEGTPGIRSLEDLVVTLDEHEITVEDWTVITETKAKVTASQLDEPMIIQLPVGTK